MEFVDNTGHMFSLPSYDEKPIGYEYEEYSYIFWIDSNNSSKLSVNNFYSRPIYALYELNKNFSINQLENDYDTVLDIEIYIDNSNVFKLISSKELQNAISREDFNLTDYIDLNKFITIEKNNTIEYSEDFNFITDKLTNKDLYCIKTKETLKDTAEINYLMIPIYPIAMATEPGTWITNVMIHIHNNSTDKDEWCYISVGGEFVSEYEELIINGKNMGISLPKDILKSIYSESLYNDEYNEALFNQKMKEYMFNYMNIRGNIGNFKSAVESLKWFGYGDRISISKLLRTDNEFKQQYILDYFDISNDLLESFKTFVSNALVSLMIYINKESSEQYPFDFRNDSIDKGYSEIGSAGVVGNSVGSFYGENRPKMISLIDNYQKILIGNHDMPIDEDEEKYWYWKPYFDFSFNELGIKLVCLSYYYKKYFLPIHLNIHSTSLGYRVFANNIKLTTTIGIAQHMPSIILNDKQEVIFLGNGIHYFTKQIHYIDDQFNEYKLQNINEDNRDWYYLNDTCVNIPIKFIKNGYYNCVLLLEKAANNEVLYESHFIFNQTDEYKYNNFIIYPKKLNINSNDGTTKYFEYWVNEDFTIKLLVNNKWYEYDFKLKIHNPTIDFGTLKYRYYINERNMLFNKILSDTNSLLHNILICDPSDTSKIQTTEFGEDGILFNTLNKIVMAGIPEDYDCYYIRNTIYQGYTYTINWDNKTDDNCYIYYEYKDNFDLNECIICTQQLIFITIDELKEQDNSILTLIIAPKEWGKPLLIKHDLRSINNFINNKLNINNDLSWMDTYDLSDELHLYQFFKQNYNIISPFTQIKKLDSENKQVLFNAYMHNSQLVDMNEINHDINLYSIIKYHLEHNLQYIDGTLLDGEFYQYIIYTDDNGKDHDVYIHKDLIGKNISFSPTMQEDTNTLICAFDGVMYVLNEVTPSSDNYEIILEPHQDGGRMIYDVVSNKEYYSTNSDELIDSASPLFAFNSSTDISGDLIEDGAYMLYDSVDIQYDSLNNIYYTEDPETGNRIKEYQIYDKLYANTDHINSRYESIINLPNNLKYKNSIHLFGIYQNEISEKNILIFHNNIDMYIDGIRFIHGITRNGDDDNQLRIYIDGTFSSDINTKFPDTYGLYWGKPFNNINNQIVLPIEELNTVNLSSGFYVKRDYSLYYEVEEDKRTNIWDLPNLFEFDTREFTYYHEVKDNYIGYITYKNLEALYNNIQLENHLSYNYKDIDIYVINDNNEHVFVFNDLTLLDLDDTTKKYKNRLSYKLEFYNSDNKLINVSLNDIDNSKYDHINVKFYYKKTHIVRNRYYLIQDYLEYLSKNNITYTYNLNKTNDKEYCDIKIDNILYHIERVNFKNKYMYKDNIFGNVISNQNPSMYWYNNNIGSIESLPMYLNDIERYILKDDETWDTEDLRNKLDNYIRLHNAYGRYADDKEYAMYHYKNYLIKDLTGSIGDYKMSLLTNIQDSSVVRLCVEVINENNTFTTYVNTDEIITFKGNERKITVYIQIDNNSKLFTYDKNNLDNSTYIIPKLIKIVKNEVRLKYNPKDYSSDNKVAKVKYLNREFEYGDNHNQATYDLYKDFFKLKFNIYDISFDNKIISPKLLTSVYDCVESLKLDEYLNYDFYLMHDYEYWYGLYISKETCDKIIDSKDFKLRSENDYTKYVTNKYILRYERSSEEYLLNRLEFNTSEGLNQFKTDDIVCCYIYNNDRLPFNAGLSSKWSIKPMSLGMSTDTSFDSNGEMTILSIPYNNSKYEPGYYKVTVKYSLDRDIQHQFKNTSTIRIS